MGPKMIQMANSLGLWGPPWTSELTRILLGSDNTSVAGGGATGPVRPCAWGMDRAAVSRAVLAGARVRRRPVHEERSEREE